ncbi:MAG: hypothetical protein U1F11_03225 [Steroidobacteraceae bacterium]
MDATERRTRQLAAARRTWRMIVAMGLAALAALGATTVTLRAAAQGTPPAATPPASPPTGGVPAGTPATPASVPKDAAPPAGETAEPDVEGPRRAATPKTADEEAPEYRESADNNISLPVDI